MLTLRNRPAGVDTIAAAPTTQGSRLVRRLALVLATALPVVVGVVGTSPASADYVGGCWSNCVGEQTISNPAGGTQTNVACMAGRLVISPSASAQAGYVNGQYVTYRYELRASNGYVGLSGWAGSTVVPYTRVILGSIVQTPLISLPVASVTAAQGLTWSVSVQYAWYASTGWQYSQFLGPTSGYQWGGTQRWYTYCYT